MTDFWSFHGRDRICKGKRGFSIPLFGDHNLYVFNQTAKETYDQMGLTRQTLPLELNSQELEQLGCQGMELVVYGYLPVMTSAQCIQKTTDRCTHRPGLLRMRDRDWQRSASEESLYLLL